MSDSWTYASNPRAMTAWIMATRLKAQVQRELGVYMVNFLLEVVVAGKPFLS
jgi:hypothetical protein